MKIGRGLVDSKPILNVMATKKMARRDFSFLCRTHNLNPSKNFFSANIEYSLVPSWHHSDIPSNQFDICVVRRKQFESHDNYYFLSTVNGSSMIHCLMIFIFTNFVISLCFTLSLISATLKYTYNISWFWTLYKNQF